MSKADTSIVPIEVQIRNVHEIAVSALSRATEALSWGGKFAKDHIECAQIEAGRAAELAELAHDEIAELLAHIDRLGPRIARLERLVMASETRPGDHHE